MKRVNETIQEKITRYKEYSYRAGIRAGGLSGCYADILKHPDWFKPISAYELERMYDDIIMYQKRRDRWWDRAMRLELEVTNEYSNQTTQNRTS